MIASLRESKTRLSELVSLANSGEEILITVHGQPKARLLPVSEPHSDTVDWLRELSDLRSSLVQPSNEQKTSALDAVREDRW
jgi:prevent-host-death family protein